MPSILNLLDRNAGATKGSAELAGHVLRHARTSPFCRWCLLKVMSSSILDACFVGERSKARSSQRSGGSTNTASRVGTASRCGARVSHRSLFGDPKEWAGPGRPWADLRHRALRWATHTAKLTCEPRQEPLQCRAKQGEFGSVLVVDRTVGVLVASRVRGQGPRRDSPEGWKPPR